MLQINPAVLGLGEEMGQVSDENIHFMLIIVKVKYMEFKEESLYYTILYLGNFLPPFLYKEGRKEKDIMKKENLKRAHEFI